MFDVAETVFRLLAKGLMDLSLHARRLLLVLRSQKPLMFLRVWSQFKRNLNLIDSIGHVSIMLENEVGGICSLKVNFLHVKR